MPVDTDVLLEALLPVWDHLPADERTSLIAHTTRRSFAKGAHVHSAGDNCAGVFIVLSGNLRVFMLSPETGKEVTLFTVGGGENCVLSAACILQMITFDIFVDALDDCELLTIDAGFFAHLIETNVYVEAFAYRQTATRFSEVMWVMQQVMFMSFDSRLAVFLLDEMARTGNSTLSITHDEIARNLGSAREVVSRMLKYFAREGMVALSRGTVELTDKHRLRELTAVAH